MKFLKSQNKYRTYLLAFVLIEIFLFTFFPGNRMEADDAFWYAASIRDNDFIDLFNPRFFLFLPLLKCAYEFLLLLGIHIDAYFFICSVNVFFSALTLLLLYDILRVNLKIELWKALFLVALLAVSYGFWRYSVEAEVYILAMFFVLLTLKLFFLWEHQPSLQHLLLVGLVASFATLLYKPNFIPVFLIFPLLLLYRKKYLHFIMYNLFGAIIIVGSFLIAYLQINVDSSFLMYLFGGANEPIGSPAGSLFVIASNMLSVLWIFSWGDVVSFITEYFPHKVVEEEVYLAQQVVGLETYFLLLVLLAIVGILFFLLVSAIKRRRQFSSTEFRVMALVILWLVLYSIFLLVMDPTSNEPWLMIQIPLIIFFGLIFIQPLKGAQLKIAYVLLLLIFINNTVGGMSLLQEQEYDYNFQKSKWLMASATPNDAIITYGPMSLIRYLRYKTPAEVINFEEEQDVAFTFLERAAVEPGEVFFPENPFKPPPAISYRTNVDLERLSALFQLKGYYLKQVAENHQFETYKLLVDQ